MEALTTYKAFGCLCSLLQCDIKGKKERKKDKKSNLQMYIYKTNVHMFSGTHVKHLCVLEVQQFLVVDT